MKFNFLSKNLPAFGLNISGSSLKLMRLEQKGKELSIKAFSSAALPKAMVVNDLISDQKAFDFLLKQNLQKPLYGRLDTNYVAASLPESKSFVRVIQIPKMSESEADSAVPFEAENFIPMPIDQVYLDWQKLGDTADKMNVLIIASPKEFVDKYLGTLDSAGLKTVALEVESQSCHRAIMAQGSTETVLLVDLDAFRSSLVMVEDGNIQFTSTVPIAGNSFTENIAKTLGVANVKAEEIKRKVGIVNTTDYPNIKTSLLPVLNNLSAEIKNILKFHAEHSDKQVTRVILSGGSAKLKNLAEFLAPQLMDAGISRVELANPWQNFSLAKNFPLSPFDSLGFVTTIGLAIRGKNFEIV